MKAGIVLAAYLLGSLLCFDVSAEENQGAGTKIMSAKQWFQKGIEYEDKNQFNNAIAAYDKAIELDPKNTGGVYNNRAILYKNMGEYKKALSDITQSIKLNPNNCYAYDTKGNIHAKLKDYKAADAAYTKAVDICSDFAGAYMNRAINDEKMGDLTKAVKDYEKVLAIADLNKDAQRYVNEANEYLDDVRNKLRKKKK